MAATPFPCGDDIVPKGAQEELPKNEASANHREAETWSNNPVFNSVRDRDEPADTYRKERQSYPRQKLCLHLVYET